MKLQLHTEAFDHMGDPNPECLRMIGRIININPEDDKLNEFNIGLLNLDEENQNGVYKIKLNMSELQSYSIFEGEIVVVEGFNDAALTKLNVVRMHKPVPIMPQSHIKFEDLKLVT